MICAVLAVFPKYIPLFWKNLTLVILMALLFFPFLKDRLFHYTWAVYSHDTHLWFVFSLNSIQSAGNTKVLKYATAPSFQCTSNPPVWAPVWTACFLPLVASYHQPCLTSCPPGGSQHPWQRSKQLMKWSHLFRSWSKEEWQEWRSF